MEEERRERERGRVERCNEMQRKSEEWVKKRRKNKRVNRKMN